MAMATGVTSAQALIEFLPDADYEPAELETGHPDYLWADKPLGTLGTIRVCIGQDDVQVYAFDHHMCVKWAAKFGSSVPGSVIVAALKAAEQEILS
jgi:hypothetical protein